MNSDYTETGGLRFGDSFWVAANATIPFAKLHVTPEHIDITLRSPISSNRSFLFRKQDVLAIRKKHGLFSVGIEIEHQDKNKCPYILFWTFRFKKLKTSLLDMGYPFEENEKRTVQQGPPR